MENLEHVSAGTTTLITPPPVRNAFYWWFGAAVLPLNKLRHAMQGYTTPRTFHVSDYRRAAEYDIAVVRSWRHYLDSYLGKPASLAGRTVLELGPGADLGIGLILTMLGARKYNALDVHDLVATVPMDLYEELFRLIGNDREAVLDVAALRHQLELRRKGLESKINYICDRNFDLRRFSAERIDLVFSQAAFEHFDDIPGTFAQLSEVVVPGGILIVEIDLSTHTRWIRDRDPLNIYRYPDFYYNFFKFRGSPNRLRPYQYKNLLEKNGWKDVRIIPSRLLDDGYMNSVKNRLSRKFTAPENHMEQLSVMLCATR